MIHTLYVSAETELAELKKLMRKKLMTGGAVIRLSDELPANDLERIFERFSPQAARNNLAAEVLAQLARHVSLPAALRDKLSSMSLPEVTRALAAV